MPAWLCGTEGHIACSGWHIEARIKGNESNSLKNNGCYTWCDVLGIYHNFSIHHILKYLLGLNYFPLGLFLKQTRRKWDIVHVIQIKDWYVYPHFDLFSLFKFRCMASVNSSHETWSSSAFTSSLWKLAPNIKKNLLETVYANR